MDLSICILTRIQPELLRRCVASCISELERASVTGEVIIIDNASTDGGPQRVADLFPGVRVIRNEENLGFAAANNKAIRGSRGRFVLILNDDAILLQDSLGLMLRKLGSDTRVGAVGPKLLNPDGSPQLEMTHKLFPNLRSVICQLTRLDRLLRRWAFTRDLFTLTRDPDRSGEAEHLAGACLLLRREALDTAGLFDEGFYFWYEDADLCYRLRETGWKVCYLAESEVLHCGSSSFKKLMRSQKAVMAFNSLFYYFKKHSSGPKVLLVRVALVLILVARLPIAVAFEMSTKDNRREWKNTAREYWRLLRWLVVPNT